MCVIAWAWRTHPRWPLVVLANRDERHTRPSQALGWWADAPEILAGRDLEAGGTWLGITRTGRLAAITNRGGTKPPDAPSRGDLVKDALTARAPAFDIMATLTHKAARYAGFNLLIGDGNDLVFVSNREVPRRLEPGVHGMANGALDEAIPKVKRLKQTLSTWCERGADPDPGAWITLLADGTTGTGTTTHPRSAIFVRDKEYGTRSSSIVTFGVDRSVHFIERNFDAHGVVRNTHRLEFKRSP